MEILEIQLFRKERFCSRQNSGVKSSFHIAVNRGPTELSGEPLLAERQFPALCVESDIQRSCGVHLSCRNE